MREVATLKQGALLYRCLRQILLKFAYVCCLGVAMEVGKFEDSGKDSGAC